MRTLKRLRRASRPLCDEESEAPWWVPVLAAFAGGAAPIVVTYVIGKLDPDMLEVSDGRPVDE